MKSTSKLALLLILVLHAGLVLNLHAQQVQDTGKKVIYLHEVAIHDGSDSGNVAFNFYQSGKLAGTEDLLARMSGVSLIRRGAFGQEPVLRNYSAGQINMTIDGMRIYSACTDHMDPVSVYVEPINLNTVQAVQGIEAGYSGSTIGGQINFQLREPELGTQARLSGQIAQSWSSNNGVIVTSGWLEKSGRNFSVRTTGSYRKAGDYRAGGGLRIPWSGYEKANFSTMMVYQIHANQQIRLDAIYDLGRNIGYPALPMDVGKANALIVSLGHRLQLSNHWLQSLNSKVYGNYILHEMDDTHRPDAVMHMDMPGTSRTFGAFSEMNFIKNIQVRVDAHQVETLSEMVMYPKNEKEMYVQTLPLNTISNEGLAIMKEFRLRRSMKLKLNGRIDLYQIQGLSKEGIAQWEIFNMNISQARHDFLKNMNLSWEKSWESQLLSRISFGYGERIPTANEMFGYYLFNRQDQSDYIGNYHLKPEAAWQLEWLMMKKFKKGLIQLNLFGHHTENTIYALPVQNIGPATPGALGLKTYTNIPFSRSIGFEFTGKYYPTDAISYLATVKYVYAETNTGVPLPLVPPLKLQHALAWSLGKFQLQLEHDFALAQHRLNPEYGDRYTPGFNLANFRVARNILVRKSILQLTASCENIGDLKYREHLDIGTIPRPGRNFMFSISYRF